MTATLAASRNEHAPVSLYAGVVMHARLKPMGHRFSYRVASLLLDLDRLNQADRQSRLFSVNRFNLFAFREADHGAGDGSPLRAWVDALLRDAGVDLDADPFSRGAGEGGPRVSEGRMREVGKRDQGSCPEKGRVAQSPSSAPLRGAPSPAPWEKARASGRVLLLCYPRILGYVFDPLSVYYCYDRADRLAALIYEVRNTFGERHAYVAPVRAGEASVAGIRQERDKLFHVSPFLGMRLRYKFRLRPPGATVVVRILACDDAGPVLAATFSGRRRALTTAALLRTFGVLPRQSLKIIVGIHWEALKLWFKGARYHRRPPAPAPANLDGRTLGER